MSAPARTALATSSNAAMMPSPVCLTSRPECRASARRTSASCTRTNSSEAASPSRTVIAVEPTIGHQNAAQSGIHLGRDTARGQARIADASEECLDRGEINRDDVGGNLAVGLAVDKRGSLGIRRFHQAKAGAARLVVPIGHVFDAVFVLDGQIPSMRFGYSLGCGAVHIVAIHKDRHGGFPSLLSVNDKAPPTPATCFESCARCYSGSVTPDPPISAGTSLNLGSPSFKGSTVSA